MFQIKSKCIRKLKKDVRKYVLEVDGIPLVGLIIILQLKIKTSRGQTIKVCPPAYLCWKLIFVPDIPVVILLSEGLAAVDRSIT